MIRLSMKIQDTEMGSNKIVICDFLLEELLEEQSINKKKVCWRER